MRHGHGAWAIWGGYFIYISLHIHFSKRQSEWILGYLAFTTGRRVSDVCVARGLTVLQGAEVTAPGFREGVNELV